jgi:probable addiction module antidote protein
MKDKHHDDAMAEILLKDKDYAVELLNSILEDGEQGELLITLRQMSKAFGGLQAVAENANLNKTQIYKTLSLEGNPALSSLIAILRAMNLRLNISCIN